MAGDLKKCLNCLMDIPSSKFEIHESHCKRHMSLCSECGDVVPNTNMEQHRQEMHALISCDLCKEKLPKHKLDDHKDNTCIEAKVECKYCELDIRRADYQEHVVQCGSRTDYCELCNQRVMLRDMSEHQETKCGHLRAESPLRETEVQELMDDDYFNDTEDNLPFPGQPPPDLPVDPQWLQTVVDACGEDNLDEVLAQNVFYENFRQAAAVHHSEQAVHQTGNYSNESVPEASTGVESNDRTISAQLQDDENEQRSLEVAKQLQERELAYQAQLERDADLARQLQDQPTEYQQQREQSSYHKQYRSPTYYHEEEQPRPKPRSTSPVQDNEEKIPCQWCNKLFPVDQITQHQMSCYADMDPPYNTQPSAVKRTEERQSTENKVPCQWCKQLFPFEQINQHQHECGYHCQKCGGVHTHTNHSESISSHTPSRETRELRMTKEVLDKISTEERISESRHETSYTECRFCGEIQLASLVSTHEPICTKNPEKDLKHVYTRTTIASGYSSASPLQAKKPMSQQTGYNISTESDSDVKIPCEICGELILLDLLVRHQARCLVQQRVKSTELHSKPSVGGNGKQELTSTSRQKMTTTSENKKNKLAIKFPNAQAENGLHHSNKSTPPSIAGGSTSSTQSLVQGRRVQGHPLSWKPNGNTKSGT